MNLKLTWDNRKNAEYAATHWHYSGCLPGGKLVMIGVWEDKSYRGSVIFSMGSNYRMASIIGMKNHECCELARVALRSHKTPVTRILRIALKMLKQQCPGLKAVMSYADRNQGHEGTIYRAGNWQHLGMCYDEMYLFKGKLKHPRTLVNIYGTRSIPWIRKHVDPTCKKIESKGKHRFVYYFDKNMRAKH